MFKKAKPIWAKDKNKEMNHICYFVCKYAGKEATLKLTGSTVYRVFLNGEFVGYGPARSAHDYYRIDELHLNGNEENIIVIEVSGYNCNNYYYPNQSSFLVAELVKNGEVIAYTGNDFDCYENTDRYQKVVRFSYQRGFSESYQMTTNPKDFYKSGFSNFKKSDIDEFTHPKYISRNISYPTYDSTALKMVETGTMKYTDNLLPYRDRYMINEYLSLFDFNNLDINVNDYVSKFKYTKTMITNNSIIKSNEFITYKADVSYTGFITLDIDVLEDADVYVIFDEYNPAEDGELIDIKFYRNTTHNVLSYKLKKGTYNLMSFEAYTAQYLRVIVSSGQVKVNNINIIKYENSSMSDFTFTSSNHKLNKIVDAALNTFAQNAVDILTDCPSRERAGWLCDSYFMAKAEKLITGNNEVEYNFLENYVLAPQSPYLPKNMIPMCYPAEFPNNEYIPNWSLFYIVELYDYLIRTGDRELIKRSYDKVSGLIEYFKKYENEDGLLEDLQGWIMIEWSHANDDEFIKGVNYPSNMLYSKALWCYGELFGDEQAINQSKKVIDCIRRDSFNGEFFEDNRVRKNNSLVQTNNISEVCQYYALYFGIANKDLYPDFYNKMVIEFGPNRDYENVYSHVHKSNVFIGDYLRLGFFLREGLYEQVFEESVDYFYRMAVLTGTLWEHDDTQASLNHGFASYILNIIVESITGYVGTSIDKKEIYFKDVKINTDFEIRIPIQNQSLHIKSSEGKLTITEPNGYKVIGI